MTRTQADLLARLHEMRALFPTRITPDQALQITTGAIGGASNWYLHRVGASNNGVFYGSVKVSCDVISDGADAIDVFRDGPDANASDPMTGEPPYRGTATVTWHVKGPISSPSVLVTTVDGPPGPGPGPGPIPPQPTPPGPSQPYPSEGPTGWWSMVFDATISMDYAEAGRLYPDPQDDASLRWCGRTAYDIGALGLTKEASLAKHRAEWRAALGLPAIPPGV